MWYLEKNKVRGFHGEEKKDFAIADQNGLIILYASKNIKIGF